jgi:hypothetical protein
MANVKNIDSLFGLVDPKDDSVRFEDELPKILFEVIPFTRPCTAFWKMLQSIDLVVKRLEPARGV